MHRVGRNAGALVRLSGCLLLRHQLPTVTGVLWFSSQEKVLGAICTGMQSCSVARRPARSRIPASSAALSRMLSWGGSCLWAHALQTFSQITTSWPLFFCKEKLAYQQLWGTVHLCSTALINRTQSAVSSARPKVLPWQHLASIKCFCAGKYSEFISSYNFFFFLSQHTQQRT